MGFHLYIYLARPIGSEVPCRPIDDNAAGQGGGDGRCRRYIYQSTAGIHTQPYRGYTQGGKQYFNFRLLNNLTIISREATKLHHGFRYLFCYISTPRFANSSPPCPNTRLTNFTDSTIKLSRLDYKTS